MYFNMYTLHTYIYDMLIFMVNVGKYTSPMDPIVTYTSHWAPRVGQKNPRFRKMDGHGGKLRRMPQDFEWPKARDVYLGFGDAYLGFV